MASSADDRRSLRFGLGFKALIFAGLLTFIASFVPVLFFYVQMADAIDGELREKGAIIAQGLARNSRTAVVVGDVGRLEGLSKGVLENRDILYVAVTGQVGDFMVSAEQERDGAALPEATDALNDLRSQKVVPESAVHSFSLAGGGAAYHVIEPVIRQTDTDDADVFGADDSAGEVIGAVAIGITRLRAEQKIRSVLLSCLAVAMVVFLLAILLVWSGTRVWVSPIVQLAATAERMAQGDLSARIAVRASDETAVLAGAFAKMGDHLNEVIGEIGTSSRVAEEILEHAGQAARGIAAGSDRQADGVASSSSAIIEMDSSIRDVASSAERMSSLVVGTTTSLEELGTSIRQIDESLSALQSVSADAGSSVLEMGANIGEAGDSIDDLSEQVERTASSIQEMTSSIRNVNELAGQMRASAETTSGRIEEMALSIREVGSASKAASEVAKNAAGEVMEGMQAVQSTADGMQAIRSGFDDTRQVIGRLGDSSREIGEIVDIINDVADRTNLLSLNAAIIAAEAGEQGRAFGVVAEEIRELAVKTAASTRDIGGLIRHVQEDVDRAVKRVEENDRSVQQGVELARVAAQTLALIQDGAQKSLAQAEAIENATVSQLAGSLSMTEEMQKLTDQALEVSRATEEQARGGTSISEAVSEMRDRALLVKKASAEQRIGGERISQNMERVTEMVQQIARATGEQNTNAKLITDAANEVEGLALEVGRSTSEQARSSAQVVSSVQAIQEVTEENREAAKAVEARLRDLRRQMDELRSLVEGLKTS